MTELFLAALAVFALLLIGWTIRVVIRDDPGPRPTRRDYDTRNPD